MIIKKIKKKAAQGFCHESIKRFTRKKRFLMVDLTKRGAVYIGYLSELQK